MTSAVPWGEFAERAPELARRAAELFTATGVVFVGTVRRDGSPRISPIEPLILDGELYLGMMAGSLKARDLLRDERCTIHSAVLDRTATGGEFKAHGRVVSVTDDAEYTAYGAALAAAIGWEPPDHAYPLFTVRFASAAVIDYADDHRTVMRWRSGSGVEVYREAS